MDTTIIAALIGGAFALLAPIITVALSKAHERRAFEKISEDRRAALAGKWTGIAHQEVGPKGKPLDIAITLELGADKKIVTGTLHFRAKIGGSEFHRTFHLTGGFIHQRFLMIRYSNTESTVVEFGNMTFELSADSKTLRGRYLGYGALSERLVYGELSLCKNA